MKVKKYPQGKHILNGSNFCNVNEENPHISGVFIGFEEVNGKFGRQTVWLIKNGSTVTRVNGSAGLNPLLEQVKKNTMVYITYKGKVKTKNKKWMKTFTVSTD